MGNHSPEEEELAKKIIDCSRQAESLTSCFRDTAVAFRTSERLNYEALEEAAEVMDKTSQALKALQGKLLK